MVNGGHHDDKKCTQRKYRLLHVANGVFEGISTGKVYLACNSREWVDSFSRKISD